MTRALIQWTSALFGLLATRSRSRYLSANLHTTAKVVRSWRSDSSVLTSSHNPIEGRSTKGSQKMTFDHPALGGMAHSSAWNSRCSSVPVCRNHVGCNN
jgi:hypothetical protein